MTSVIEDKMAGMITNQVYADGGHVEYTYDDLDRLTGEKKLDSTNGVIYQKTYTYDLVGNRLTAVIDGVTDVYTLGTGNRLASWGVSGTVSYADAGNVTNVTYQDGRSLDIAWNDRYEITSVSTNGTTLESYEYDALGRRVKIENAGSTNYLVYDGIHVVAEVDSDGTLQKSYTYGVGVDNLLAMTDHTSTQTYFYVKDHLGSVIAVVDETGTNIVERYEYDAWGNVTAYDADDSEIDESQIGNRYLWQGREYSWTTGLYNFRARWYDPITGRWLSKDPIGISGGLNQYVFCGDDPVNTRDPLGSCKDSNDQPWYQKADQPWYDDVQDFFYKDIYLHFKDYPYSQIMDDPMWDAMPFAIGVAGTTPEAIVALRSVGPAVGLRGPEYGKWGPEAARRSGYHFHMGTHSGLWRHHLPQQIVPWLKNLWAVVKRKSWF